MVRADVEELFEQDPQHQREARAPGRRARPAADAEHARQQPEGHERAGQEADCRPRQQERDDHGDCRREHGPLLRVDRLD
jgi:hypothetical protein